jgi:hypothetical protein
MRLVFSSVLLFSSKCIEGSIISDIFSVACMLCVFFFLYFSFFFSLPV